MVAAAAIGAAVIGGVASNAAANTASDASADAADSASAASRNATSSQIAETRRQFDYQQTILRPQIQRQYEAQQRFTDILGISAPGAQPNVARSPTNSGIPFRTSGGQTGTTGSDRPPIYDHRTAQPQPYRAGGNGAPQNYFTGGYGDTSGGGEGGWASDIGQGVVGNIDRELGIGFGREGGFQPAPTGGYGFQAPVPTENAASQGMGQIRTRQGGVVHRGPNGEFIDPNIDPTRLADQTRLEGQVRSTMQAGRSAETDEYTNYIRDNQIAASDPSQDVRVQRANTVRNAGDSMSGDDFYQDVQGRSLADGAAGTGVYGDVFEESKGYEFSREQMGRELDRKNSAGGNYGGRAIMEAQRRAKGLADGEYYNWAAGRTQDLSRQAGAEATDASRLDAAGINYMTRKAVDINRGDTALSQYEGQRMADVGRGDDAYQNFLSRRAGDASRLDSAVSEQDRLMAHDQARGDQSYYNYLANVGSVAGFSNPAAQAVDASKAAGGAVSNAYAREGSQLSNIYQNAGAQEAQIQSDRYANINNAAQSGIQNYFTYQQTTQPKAA